jgi:hypothetical protein
LAHLRKKDKWVAQASAMIDGVSTSKAAKRCDVDYKTAFRWRHRFLDSLSGDKPRALSGIVEGDETFILESFKGKRSGISRAARKRGGKPAKCGISAEQIPVIVARDRHGATTDAVLPKLNRVSITAALGGVVTPRQRILLRWWLRYCCLRPQGWNPDAHPTSARQTKPTSSRFSHQQRQCLSQSPKGMDASLPWRRH